MRNVHSYGLTLLSFALSFSALAHSLHVSELVSMILSGASIACSLAAIVLFMMQRPERRKPMIAMIAAMFVVGGTAFAMITWVH